MGYIEWVIKDGLQGLSLKEYEEEWDTVYGYMVLKLGDGPVSRFSTK